MCLPNFWKGDGDENDHFLLTRCLQIFFGVSTYPQLTQHHWIHVLIYLDRSDPETCQLWIWTLLRPTLRLYTPWPKTRAMSQSLFLEWICLLIFPTKWINRVGFLHHLIDMAIPQVLSNKFLYNTSGWCFTMSVAGWDPNASDAFVVWQT